ncbi:MAG: DUF6084 family protein [Isosphaeraceae bacterium]
MPDLDFRVENAEPQRFAATPQLLFKVRVVENARTGWPMTPIHSIILRCQVRIEPARRRYGPAEEPRLLDLFGTPERWGQTMRSLLWTHVNVSVPPFTGETIVELPVPCSFDLSLAATRYFHAVKSGDLPLCFLFSGTIFHESPDGDLRVAQISWEKEAAFRLTASTWHELVDAYYPGTTWLNLRRDVFDRFDQYRSRRGLPTPEAALERLLAAAGEH